MAPSLRFKRYLRPVVVEGHGAYLFSEAGVTALHGSHVEALVPLLDGSRDLEALLRDASAEASPAELAGLVSRLIAAGLVEECVPVEAVDEQEMAYWETAGLDANLAAERTVAGRVNLIVLGGTDEAEAERVLRLCGLHRATPATTPDPRAGKTGQKWCDLSVVLCDDYLDPALARVDAEHRAMGRPWLLAKPTGATLYIGPVFQPGDGACWTCMVHRLWANRRAEAQVQRVLQEAGPAPRPAVGIGSSRASGVCLTMLEAAKWIAGHRHASQHDILTLDAVTLRTERHQLRRRPQCETCGDPGLTARQAWRAITPQSRVKTSCEGGGHRALPPERVLRRYGHLISPITGLVSEIRRDPRGPEFLNAYVAGENPVPSRSPRDPAGIRAGMRALTGGKGVTPLHAQVSALCEALERRSGSYHGDELRLRASFEELGGRAVHPDSCQLYHERQ
jgi:ribosomal protein S12 methylthiotransferase accessory factor